MNTRHGISGGLLRSKRFAIPAIILLVILVAVFVVRPIFAARGQTKPLEGVDTAEVTRGTIQRSVSAFGYLVMPRQVKLTFGGSGKIKELKVKMGDTVKKGDVLARLDITTLEVALLRAEDTFVKARRAYDDINQPFSEVDIAVAKATLAAAEAKLTGAYQSWATDQGSASKWSSVKSAEADLEKAREAWHKIEAGPDPDDVADAERQMKIAQAALDDARRQIDEAIIVAPYDGIVAQVFVTEGSRASADTTQVVSLVDPTTFELQATVDEIDISRVRAGQQVSISVDALPDTTFPGKVIAVGPVGSRQSGVVSFPITISVDTATTPSQRTSTNRSGGAATRQSTTGGQGGGQGTPPRQQPQGTAPQGSGTRQQNGGTSADGGPGTTPATRQTEQPSVQFTALKEGLTATGTIIIEQKANVLTVPSRAIRTQRGRATVEVVVGAGTEQREVVVGITDGTRTEIISGLGEKERVVIPKTAIRATNVPTTPGGGFGGPGGFR